MFSFYMLDVYEWHGLKLINEAEIIFFKILYLASFISALTADLKLRIFWKCDVIQFSQYYFVPDFQNKQAVYFQKNALNLAQ